jgi:long-chain fatty acid transport protein
VTSRRSLLATAASSAALACVVLAAAPAGAAGLYYADRGVRPLGRAGAFVAGADDLGAMVYNPAGIYESGGQFLFDASWVDFSSSYTRVANVPVVDPNTGMTTGTYQETSPTVHGTTPFLPIPTIAISFKLNRNWVLALGTWAPYAALTTYPDTVNGSPAPQRYSLLSLDGSLLAFVGAGVGFAPNKEWRFGATVGMLTGVFTTRATFSGCIQIVCPSEEPSWDVLAQLNVGPIFAPTGSLGAIWIPNPAWRVGASFQLPVWVRSPATLNARLPSAAPFANATQQGTSGEVAFDLPWMLRVGVETRLVENLRVELSGEYDRWSMHDSITLTPDKIALLNVVGLSGVGANNAYYVPPITLPRHFQDSFSVHLGGEYTIKNPGNKEIDLTARAGVSYESSAIPNAYESVLTIDQNKITAAVGGSLTWRKLRLDFVYAHVFGFDVNVNPSNAGLPLISPVLENPPKTPDYINGGMYSAHAEVLGLGLAYTFDPALPDPSAPPPAK